MGRERVKRERQAGQKDAAPQPHAALTFLAVAARRALARMWRRYSKVPRARTLLAARRPAAPTPAARPLPLPAPVASFSSPFLLLLSFFLFRCLLFLSLFLCCCFLLLLRSSLPTPLLFLRCLRGSRGRAAAGVRGVGRWACGRGLAWPCREGEGAREALARAREAGEAGAEGGREEVSAARASGVSSPSCCRVSSAS